MQPASAFPTRLEGLFFPLMDLELAMAWVSANPPLRLSIRTDFRSTPEVIEVYPPGCRLPRWRLWLDRTGRLHVDDWTKGSFNLPYPTVSTALAFIATCFAEEPRQQNRTS